VDAKRLGISMLAALWIPLLACDGSPSSPDDASCPQTYEFGNYGCALIEGQVTDASGSSLSGIDVGPVHLEGRDCCNTVFAETDVDGHYSFMIHRFAPPPADTTTMFVRASRRTHPRWKDSVRVVIRFAAVGDRAPINRVDLVLGGDD